MSETFGDQFKQVFDSLAERLQAEISQHASQMAERLGQAVDADRQSASTQAAREAALSTERMVTARLTDAFAAREVQVRNEAHQTAYDAALQQARAEALDLAEARQAAAQAASSDTYSHAALERLTDAVRVLDSSASLSQTLDALASAARGEAERVVLFLVRDRILRPWGRSDFQVPTSTAAADIEIDQAGVAAEAVRTASSRNQTTPEGRPAFAGASTGAPLVAVPVVMNGQVIAVLCGEEASSADDGHRLMLTCELFARHAARLLESLTARRLAQVGTVSSAPGLSGKAESTQ